MIAQLRGTIVSAAATSFVIDVAGVGYLTNTTPRTSAGLRVGESSTIHTSLVVREDSLTLFGFAEAGERDTFELLLTASGVGPKLAVAVVSMLSPAELRAAIASEDLGRLCSVPGIGRKGAQRLVLELKDKVNQLASLADDEQPVIVSGGWRDQISAGLESLGWSTKDAAAACEAVAPLVEEQPDIAIPELMRAALVSLGRR